MPDGGLSLLIGAIKVFDVICGTSTGGILAMLFASEKQSLASASTMYDSLIVKIFRKDLLANAKLVLWQVCCCVCLLN